MDRLTLQGVGMTSKRTRDRLVERLRSAGITNEEILDVVASTPRHVFVDEALAHRAYEDTALPIGYGQTISQPYIVARMTELLIEHADNTLNDVLEIGTGCGYQTSILAQLLPNIYSVERIRPLQERARQRLRKLGLRNISFQHADGGLGWSGADKQFDGILSAAAPQTLPQSLLEQLKPGGVLIIPVGGDEQMLTLVHRDSDTSDYTTTILEPVKFVPLVSGKC